jgi:RND family efflux transporter MFP subunit
VIRHLVTLLAGALGIAACSHAPGRDAADPRPPVAVQTATLAVADVAEAFETGGVIAARTTATLTSRVLAPVAAVRVVAGDRVRAGQVLVVLDSRDLAARAESARAAARGATQRTAAAKADARAYDAALTLARTTRNRIQSLHARGSATTQELDEASAALDAAEARAAAAAARLDETAAGVAGAEADSDAATTTESYTRIAAPFDGIVTETMVEAGNMAAPGTPLVRLEDARALRLDIRVDESRVGTVAVGDEIAVSLESGREGAAGAMRGTVAEVARAVDSDARAFIVKIALPPAAGLRSGMFGRARMTGRPRRVLTVPAEAIVRRGQIATVFVVDKGVARLRLVDVAGREVLAGLSSGETVVLGPPVDLVDGRRVTAGAGS